MRFNNFKNSEKKPTKPIMPLLKTKPTSPVVKQLQKHDVVFDVSHLGQLMNKDDCFNAVPNYINKFFFKFGNDVFYDTGREFELLSRADAKQLIPKNYFKEIQVQKGDKTVTKKFLLSDYFDSDIFLKTNESRLTIDYEKDIKFVKTEHIRGVDIPYNYLNMKKDLPRDYTQPIDMKPDTMEGVNMYFKHINDMLCSGIEEEYEVVTKFLASSFMGHKVKFCLLVQTLKEQTGKGTIFNALIDILGDRYYRTSNPEEFVLYNKPFEGRCLINIDEMPMAGEVKRTNDIAKSYITEPNFSCRQMRCQPYDQKNTFNLIFTSNNDCVLLTQSNNIRYYVPTTNNKFQGNKEYFDKLHGFLKREDVKRGIFNKFKEIYETKVKPTGWIGNDIGTTQAKNIKVIESLPAIIKYIKKHYLFNGLGIDASVKDFIEEYRNTSNDKTHDSKLSVYLHDLGIETKRVNNKEFNGRKYIISIDNLLQGFKTKNWLTPDELIDLESLNIEQIEEIEEKEEIIEKKNLEKENEELKKQIEELKKQIELLKPKVEIKQEIKPVKEDLEIPEELKSEVKSKKNKSKAELIKKVQKARAVKALKSNDYISDESDGYDTDELENTLDNVMKKIKK